MFGSRSIAEHLGRGAVGIGSLAAAAAWTGSQPLVWLVAVPVALAAFRGCPMCWTVGLAETIAGTIRRRSAGATGTPGCTLHRASSARRRG